MKLSTGKIIYLVILVIAIFFVGRNFMMNDSSKIDEIKNAVVVSEIDSANDGKLVLYTNDITCQTVKDDVFGIEVVAPNLRREVEIYDYELDSNNTPVLAWIDDENGGELLDENDNVVMTADGKQAILTESLIKDLDIEGTDVKVGDVVVSAKAISSLDAENKIYEPENKDEILTFNGKKYYYVDGYYTTCPEVGREMKGDIRIKYTYKDLSNVKEVSILGMQDGNEITEYETSKGAKVLLMRKGKVTVNSFANAIAKKDASSKKTSVVVLVVVLVIGIFVFKKKKDVPATSNENKTNE